MKGHDGPGPRFQQAKGNKETCNPSGTYNLNTKGVVVHVWIQTVMHVINVNWRSQGGMDRHRIKEE
eukprot:11328587-Karenia_brevis.AAC.1